MVKKVIDERRHTSAIAEQSADVHDVGEKFDVFLYFRAKVNKSELVVRSTWSTADLVRLNGAKFMDVLYMYEYAKSYYCNNCHVIFDSHSKIFNEQVHG